MLEKDRKAAWACVGVRNGQQRTLNARQLGGLAFWWFCFRAGAKRCMRAHSQDVRVDQELRGRVHVLRGTAGGDRSTTHLTLEGGDRDGLGETRWLVGLSGVLGFLYATPSRRYILNMTSPANEPSSTRAAGDGDDHS